MRRPALRWQAQTAGAESAGEARREETRRGCGALHPSDNWAKKARRHIAAQRLFAASSADVPGGVSAQDAAGDGAGGQQPWISAVRYKPQQQQVSAARKGQRDDRRIDHRNGEQPQRSEVRKPMRDRRRMDAYHGMPNCRLDKKAHRHLAVQLNTEAPEYPARQETDNFASLSHGNKPSTRAHVPAPHIRNLQIRPRSRSMTTTTRINPNPPVG